MKVNGIKDEKKKEAMTKRVMGQEIMWEKLWGLDTQKDTYHMHTHICWNDRIYVPNCFHPIMFGFLV